MIYLEIPYAAENNRIDKDVAKSAIESLDIDDEVKKSVYAAIYNLHPRGVDFDNKNPVQVLLLEETLRKLGVPYKKSEVTNY